MPISSEALEAKRDEKKMKGLYICRRVDGSHIECPAGRGGKCQFAIVCIIGKILLGGR